MFRESGIEGYFFEIIWNLFSTEGADRRMIPSIDVRRAFVRDTVERRDEIEDIANDVDVYGDFKGTVFVDKVAASGARDKLREIQQLCKDIGKSVPTLVIGRIELSRGVIEMKRNNSKLVDSTVDLEKELDYVRPVEQLVCVNLEVASAYIKAIEIQVKEANLRYAKEIEETTQTEGYLRLRTTT